MKNSKSKKLIKPINTVFDYNIGAIRQNGPDTTLGTDPTNTTATTITTINTHIFAKS